jgi:hypothetical protein
MSRTPGVFPTLIDERAFFDKVTLSIRGEKSLSTTYKGILSNRINRPAGGKHSNYSRVECGVVVWTGNPHELRYAPIRLQKIIPSMVLVLRSDRSPVTVEEMACLAQALCKERWQVNCLRWNSRSI